MDIKIAPSLLSADFSCLGEEIRKVEKGGCDLFHLDIMDGHFVPNITFGPIVIKDIRKSTNLPLDVHLMIDKPEKWIDKFVSVGADWISFHIEATKEPKKVISIIKEYNKLAGIAINPPTPIEKIMPFINLVDFVLVMTVNPGFGGQSFIEEPLDKIRVLSKKGILIEVDGGIKLNNVKKVIDAGAKIIVSGSGIFNTPDSFETTKKFKEMIKNES